MALKLRVGGKYRRRDGKVVTIRYYGTFGLDDYWSEEHDRRYTASGRHYFNETQYDLIEEFTEGGTVSKEFKWDEFNKVLQGSKNICAGARADIEKAIKAGQGEKEPEVKAGQVWQLKADHKPGILVPKTSGGGVCDYVLFDSDGMTNCGTVFEKDGKEWVRSNLRDGRATLLADSLADYFKKKGNAA